MPNQKTPKTAGNGPGTKKGYQDSTPAPKDAGRADSAIKSGLLAGLWLLTLAPIAAFGFGPLGGGGGDLSTANTPAEEFVFRSYPPAGQVIPATTTLPAPTPKPSAIEFISDAVKRSEADTFLTIGGQKGAALFVPLRVLNWPAPEVLDVGLGAAGGLGKPEGLASVRLNIPQVFNAIAGTRWFAKNTTGPVLPSLFIGPAVKAAWPVNSFRWDNDAMLLLGIPFSSIGGK